MDEKLPARKDVENTRNPKEVPLPADIDDLRKAFPEFTEARRLFGGSGPNTARGYVEGQKIDPKTAVDQRHADLLRDMRAKFDGKDQRTIEALSVINQTQAQLLRLQQVNDKTRAVPTDEEKYASGREAFYTVLPGLIERNFGMIDRYLVLKKQHAAYGVAADPALEKAVQDQLKKFNTAAAARLALWGTNDITALQRATEALKEAVNPLPVLTNALYGDLIDRALRQNNSLILKKGNEYEVELRLLLKKGTVTQEEKNALAEKFRGEVAALQKVGASLGVELESLLRHTGLENIADIEEFTIPEGQRQYQKPAAVAKAPSIPLANAAAAEGEKIMGSTVDALTENFRGHFDMVLGPRPGRPAKGFEKDHLLSTKRWDMKLEQLWTEQASARAAMVLNLLAKYRGGVRSMVVNGPRKVAVGVTRSTLGDTVADTLDFSMKKVLSTKEGSEYAKDNMAGLLKAMGLPEDFDLNSAKDWKDLEEDKRWPGAKAKHEAKMTSVKANIEKCRAEVEGPAKEFETDLVMLESLRKKTSAEVLLGKKADPALVEQFVTKGLTAADIADLDPKDGPRMLAAYVALYLQMRGHWNAYARAMGKLEGLVMENIQAHQDKKVEADIAAGNQKGEDDDFLKWLVFGAAGLATAYALGGRGGFARLGENRIGFRRPFSRIANGIPSLFDRTLISGPARAVKRGSLIGYLEGFLKPGQTPTEAMAEAKAELATLRKEREADRARILELEERIKALEAADDVVVDEARVEGDASGRTAETEIDPARIDLGKMDARAIADLAVKLDIKVDGRSEGDVKADVEAALKAGAHPKIKRK